MKHLQVEKIGEKERRGKERSFRFLKRGPESTHSKRIICTKTCGTSRDCSKVYQNMASTSFRNSMNSLGWSRRESDAPTSTNSTTPILSTLSSLNPFGRGGYVQLPTTEPSPPGAPLPAPTRREEEEGWFACKWSFYSLYCSARLDVVHHCITAPSYLLACSAVEAFTIPKQRYIPRDRLPSDLS